MAGTLYGVSVGPGDPQLMTLKAVSLIGQCQVIAVPKTKGENSMALSIAEQVCDMSDKQILTIDFPMSKDQAVLEENYKRAAELCISHLEKNQNIACLNIGDISVYSTFSYVAQIVQKEGFTVENCPGITSFCAAAAAVGKPLVQGKEALLVMPVDTPDFETLLDAEGTRVIMKSSRRLEQAADRLKSFDFYAVENCGMENQKIYADVDDMIENSGYFTTIVAK